MILDFGSSAAVTFEGVLVFPEHVSPSPQPIRPGEATAIGGSVSSTTIAIAGTADSMGNSP